MIDYSKRLLSLSWHFLTSEECDARAKADIQPDFMVCDLRALPGDGEYFDPKLNSFSQLCGGKGLDCLQIDLLRPVYDYYSLKYNSLIFLLVDIERQIISLLEERGIDAEWSMIGCTTENDSPVSAVRRTLVFPNTGFNGEVITNSPRTADLSLTLISELERQLEEYFLEHAPIEHYA
ncbi:hypothetical protein [Rhizorhapis sp. SPR117]|uniref:hypothetical protein n=1 Tax=Rhizorhapis sp. SPR117 TaxID=2912611 RepID=UPI001F48132E